MIALTECRSKTERKIFERVAEILCGHDKAFVPPFPGSIVKYLSPESAFCQRHGEIIPFIAWRNGRIAGRIAAIVNRTHNEYHKDRTAFFGFFECEDNQETANTLFEQAAALLRAKGFTTIRGPYNPSINDECGLLVNCHELPPYTGMTWNPPYYEKLLTTWGLKSQHELYGLLLPMHRLELPARLKRIVDRIAQRSNLSLRPFVLEKLDQELEIVHAVYNHTLERNWGFVPISMEDLLGAADDLRAIAEPELLLVAESKGENAGVALTLPNFNEILHKTRRTPRFLRLLHIVWLMKTHKINSCRQTVLGVTPTFRDRGIHAWLVYEQFAKAQARYDNAILGWVEDTNTEVLELCESVGGERERTWRIYEKALV